MTNVIKISEKCRASSRDQERSPFMRRVKSRLVPFSNEFDIIRNALSIDYEETSVELEDDSILEDRERVMVLVKRRALVLGLINLVSKKSSLDIEDMLKMDELILFDEILGKTINGEYSVFMNKDNREKIKRKRIDVKGRVKIIENGCK